MGKLIGRFQNPATPSTQGPLQPSGRGIRKGKNRCRTESNAKTIRNGKGPSRKKRRTQRKKQLRRKAKAKQIRTMRRSQKPKTTKKEAREKRKRLRKKRSKRKERSTSSKGSPVLFFCWYVFILIYSFSIMWFIDKLIKIFVLSH